MFRPGVQKGPPLWRLCLGSQQAVKGRSWKRWVRRSRLQGESRERRSPKGTQGDLMSVGPKHRSDQNRSLRSTGRSYAWSPQSAEKLRSGAHCILNIRKNRVPEERGDVLKSRCSSVTIAKEVLLTGTCLSRSQKQHLLLTGAGTKHSVKEESSLRLIWTRCVIRQYTTNAIKLTITISKAKGKKSGL